MKKYILSAITYVLTSSIAMANLPDNLFPTNEESAAMMIEADNFIDSLPDGMQDRQADALYHAIRGMSTELEKFRKDQNSATHPVSKNIKVTEITGDKIAGGIKMCLYHPSTQTSPLPLLIYFHGGGWCFGGISSCASFCEALAETERAMVLAVDYSLAPENPFPKALEECCATVKYASSHHKEWNASSISIGGDSAGGNLALATILSIQKSDIDDKSPDIESVVLLYPVLKAFTDKTPSWKKYARGYGLDARLMEAFNAAYLASSKSKLRASEEEVLSSPMMADEETLKKLPPVLIINAGRDILLDQGKEFYDRLKSMGKDAISIVFPEAVHLFVTVKGQPTAFKKAVELTASFLNSQNK